MQILTQFKRDIAIIKYKEVIENIIFLYNSVKKDLSGSLLCYCCCCSVGLLVETPPISRM